LNNENNKKKDEQFCQVWLTPLEAKALASGHNDRGNTRKLINYTDSGFVTIEATAVLSNKNIEGMEANYSIDDDVQIKVGYGIFDLLPLRKMINNGRVVLYLDE
jgi:hypothetical protein